MAKEAVIWVSKGNKEVALQVRDDGIVRNLETGHIYNPKVDRYGYHHIQLSIGGKKVYPTIHRLVALAFLDNPDDLPEVNHKDGVKSNNQECNLEWCSHKENMLHAVRTGLKKPGHNKRSKPVRCVETGRVFPSVWSAVRYCGDKNNSTLRYVLKGGNRLYHGLHWEYSVEGNDMR